MKLLPFVRLVSSFFCYSLMRAEDPDLAQSRFEYAGLFRAEAALDFSTGLKLAGKDSSLHLLRNWSICQYDPRVWEYFFSGTLISTLPEHSEGYFSYYHPYLEVALITQWKSRGKGKLPEVVHAWFESYPVSGPGEESSEPSWINDEAGMIPALQRQVRDQSRQFEERLREVNRSGGTLNPQGECPPSWVESRLAYFLYFRNRYFSDQPTAATPAWKHFADSLRQGDWERLQKVAGENQPVPIERMQEWPADIRAGLIPHIALPIEGAMVSFFWNHRLPKAVLSAVFDKEDDALLAWSSVTLGSDETEK